VNEMNHEVRSFVDAFLEGLEQDAADLAHNENPAEAAARRFIIDTVRDNLFDDVCTFCEAPLDACECDDE
jgi:hypothetical protein